MKLYANLAFLENLFLDEQQTDRHFFIKRLLGSRQSAFEVIVDVDIEEVYESRDPNKQAMKVLLRQIAQNINSSEPNFIAICQTPDFHKSAEPKLLFVDDVHLTVEQEFGCFCVSTKNLEKADFLFYAEEIRIDNQQQDWSSLKKIKHPCNALVITDNYLFSDKKTYLENIKSICESLMPTSMSSEFSFDITLIGHDSRNDHWSIKEQYDLLVRYLQKFPYCVNLTIIRETYHDRYIFTNYYRISSGNGFSLFKDKQLIPGKRTTIHCKSLTYEGRFSLTYQTRNDELRKCQDINRAERVEERWVGSKVNRLLT